MFATIITIWEIPVDRYSKLLLTVIAASLLWLGIKDFSIVEDVMAATGVVEVKIVSMNLPSYQPIPVEIRGKVDCGN